MHIINSDLDNINKIFSPAKNAGGNVFLNQTGPSLSMSVNNYSAAATPPALPSSTPSSTPPAVTGSGGGDNRPGAGAFMALGNLPAGMGQIVSSNPNLTLDTQQTEAAAAAATAELLAATASANNSLADGVYVSTPAPVVTTPPANNNNVILIGGVVLGAIGLIVGLVMHFKEKLPAVV